MASADDIRKDALGSLRSGNSLGENPSESELRREVQRLKQQGKDGYEIGEQIGAYYVVKDDNDTLDLLEEILTDEFDDYGGEA